MENFPCAESQVAVLFEVLRHRDNVRHALPHLVLRHVAPGGVGSPVLPLLFPPVSQLRLRAGRQHQPVRLLRPSSCRDSLPHLQSSSTQPGYPGLAY